MDDLEQEITDYAVIINSQPISYRYDVYISGDIGPPSDYGKVFQLFQDSTENDEIYLHINSSGGIASTAVQFRNYIKKCRATVIGCAEGYCLSAASMIFLSCDSFIISDFSLMLVHNYTSTIAGKGGEIFDQISFVKNWTESLFREIYEHFLEEDEISKIISGKDFWLNHNQIKDRVKEMLQKRNNQEKIDG